MQILIELVSIDEIQILSDISRQTFRDSFEEYNTKDDMNLFLEKNLDAKSLQHEMMNAKNAFFFARIDGEIAGFIKLSSERTTEQLAGKEVIEIARLYALKDKIGTGVGKALMQFAESFAKQLNRTTIWLGVWEHNQRAINFYQRFGFEKFSEHLFILGNDPQTDWLMKKKLS